MFFLSVFILYYIGPAVKLESLSPDPRSLDDAQTIPVHLILLYVSSKDQGSVLVANRREQSKVCSVVAIPVPEPSRSRDLEYSPVMSRRPKLVLIPDPCRATQHSQIQFLLVAVPVSTEIRDQYRLRKVGNDARFYNL